MPVLCLLRFLCHSRLRFEAARMLLFFPSVFIHSLILLFLPTLYGLEILCHPYLDAYILSLWTAAEVVDAARER